MSKYFYKELEKISVSRNRIGSTENKSKKSNRNKLAQRLAGIGAFAGTIYGIRRGMFPKNPARSPMHSLRQSLTNTGSNIYTIGTNKVTDTRSKQLIINLGGYAKPTSWTTTQKAGPFPLVELRKGKQGVWVAQVGSLTKDSAGRWSPILVKQKRAGMFTNKQKEKFAREAYDYAVKMHGKALSFPKWNN